MNEDQLGRRDDTVTIDETTTVEYTATITDHARVRNLAKVREHATVTGYSTVEDTAQATLHATIENRGYLGGAALATGNAVVSNARVYGSAVVGDSAHVHSGADISYGTLDLTADVADRVHYLNMGPIGSENRVASFFRAWNPGKKSWVGIIAAGCFRGTTDRLERRMDNKQAWDPDYSRRSLERWETEYRALIELARIREATWSPPTALDMDYWDAALKVNGAGYLISRLRDYEVL